MCPTPTCQTTEPCTGNAGSNDWTLHRKLWLWDALPYSPPQMRLCQWMFIIFIWSGVPGASFNCYRYLRWNILKSKSGHKTNIKLRSSSEQTSSNAFCFSQYEFRAFKSISNWTSSSEQFSIIWCNNHHAGRTHNTATEKCYCSEYTHYHDLRVVRKTFKIPAWNKNYCYLLNKLT